MRSSRPAKEANEGTDQVEAPFTVNLYPLLGIVLAVVLAVLTYGGLFLFLL
jgi:hypothetical protein